MYNDDVNRIPRSKDELWEILEEQFYYVRQILWETPTEEKEDALSRKYVKHTDGTNSKDRGMKAIRYRDGRYDQRDYYLNMGRDLLPCVHQAIDERTFTPEFLQQWGKIMFCHGYMASYYFDDGDNLFHIRAGTARGIKRSKNTQRKWLAHLFTQLVAKGETRHRAEERIVSHIETMLKDAEFPPGFDHGWFAVMLTRGGLAATYDEKHLSLRKMQELALEPTDDIPPIPKIP